MNKEEIVRKSYDLIASNFADFRKQFDNYKELKVFTEFLPNGGKILDLGCGTGIPIAQFLVSKGFQVIGVDISHEMIKMAKQNVPEAIFIEKDMSEIKFQEKSFDGICAVYTIFHIPKEKHLYLFKKIFKLLKTNGIFFFCLGTSEGDSEHEMLGSNMFWSNYSPERTKKLVENAGFKILSDEIRDIGDELMYWVFAKKP